MNPRSELKQMAESEMTLKGMTIVVTGKLKDFSREEARRVIKDRGGNSPASVSAKTTYLLAGEGGGSKLDQAEKFGVSVIDESVFSHLIENGELPE